MVLLLTISFQKVPNVSMVPLMLFWNCANLEENPRADFSSKRWSGQGTPDHSTSVKNEEVTGSLFITLPRADENLDLLK